MTIEECQKRNNAILETARKMASGEDEILFNGEIEILAAMLNVRMPLAAKRYLNKVYNLSPCRINTTTCGNASTRTIFNFLKELKGKLKEQNNGR